MKAWAIFHFDHAAETVLRSIDRVRAASRREDESDNECEKEQLHHISPTRLPAIRATRNDVKALLDAGGPTAVSRRSTQPRG